MASKRFRYEHKTMLPGQRYGFDPVKADDWIGLAAIEVWKALSEVAVEFPARHLRLVQEAIRKYAPTAIEETTDG